MAYRRNPMCSERICALSRFLRGLLMNPVETAATQWLERTLDDSANRRLTTSQAFLTADAIWQLGLNVSSGLVVHEAVIARHLSAELPFMATETVLMETVRRGGDRQELPEVIRRCSMEAASRVNQEDCDNDLLERLAGEPAFQLVKDDLDGLCDPSRFVGRVPEQVEEYLAAEIDPNLAEHQQALAGLSGEVRV
ncbi:MAG: adenylosuccinate lyase [Pseudohongiellaceae bacterium]|jgi:adenylosuccinate lyase